MPPPPPRLLPGLQKQLSIISALMIRDVMARFGRDNIGFAWVILEPLFLCSGVMLIWRILYGADEHGVPLLEIVITAYLPVTMWRQITGNAALIFRRNASLLLHRSISLFDILFARQLLEFASITAAAIVLWCLLAMLGLTGLPERFDLLVGGWFTFAALAMASGAVIGAITERWDLAERLVQPIQYIILPISGVFFLLDWVPDEGRRLLLFNPMVSCYEMIRAGYWGAKVPTYYIAWYPWVWAGVLFFIGVHLVSRTRNHIQLN